LFPPTVKQGLVEKANKNPTTVTTSSFGMRGHSAAIYEPRKTPHKKDPIGQANRQLSQGSNTFHKELSKLLKQYLNQNTDDFQGFLAALQQRQEETVWGGEIEGLDQTAAQNIPGDLRRGAKASSSVYGNTMAELQQGAQEAKERNRQIMQNRTNAMLNHPSFGFAHLELPQEEVYVTDEHGKTVDDYTHMEESDDEDNQVPYTTATLPPAQHLAPLPPQILQLNAIYEQKLRELDTHYYALQTQQTSDLGLQQLQQQYLSAKNALELQYQQEYAKTWSAIRQPQ
jgi:hypothetical protein